MSVVTDDRPNLKRALDSRMIIPLAASRGALVRCIDPISPHDRRVPASPITVRFAGAVLCATGLLTAPLAGAERADENAVVAASDAFGTTIGLQTIGLYSPTDARGFNPTQAGNLRIEGLYFDQQTQGANVSLFSGSEMKIGVAAQSYSFPSPTGVADYKLRTPGSQPMVSALVTRGPLEASTLQIDAQYPVISDTLSAGLSIADWQDFDYNVARRSRGWAVGLVLHIRPSERTEVVPFVGYVGGGEHRQLPAVFADGIHPLPVFDQQRLPSQDWTSSGWGETTAGVIVKSALGGQWRLVAGLFRSIEDDPQNYNDLLLGLAANRTADHVMDVVPPQRAGSYSGDLRLTRLAVNGAHQHEFQLAVRGRKVERHFGGDSVTDLGTIVIDRTVYVPEPPRSFSAIGRDDVHQTGIGVSYEERWTGVGTLNLGVLKTDYSRSLATPGTASTPQHTKPVLPTISFTAEAGHALTFYGSYTRGLEDSVNAPASALNRGEPPPATPTWQVDGGVRAVPRSNLQLLLGAFTVHKGYFNLDIADRYRQLGEVSNRGIEGSATLSTADGLTVVAGFVLIKSEVRREIAELRTTGDVPVGPVPATLSVNADYAPSRWAGWATSLKWTSLSSRIETETGVYKLPPISTLDAGLRYMRKVYNHPCSARFDVGNLTNSTGLTISPQYLALPQVRRNVTLTFAIDL
jgi:iron complex outermembrane recepter protein